MKTYNPTEKDFDRKSYLIDATDKTLGHLATRIASLLIGKGKTCYTPDQLCGDQVVVINAEKIHLTGLKMKKKVYTHYTGFPGGLRSQTLERLQNKKPELVITKAVARMIPNNSLGRRMLRSLRVYTGPKHLQQSQQPIALEL